MKLIKGNGTKRELCKKCNEIIYSTDKKYIGDKGVFCYQHGRIESLYTGFAVWLRGYLHAAL